MRWRGLSHLRAGGGVCAENSDRLSSGALPSATFGRRIEKFYEDGDLVVGASIVLVAQACRYKSYPLLEVSKAVV